MSVKSNWTQENKEKYKPSKSKRAEAFRKRYAANPEHFKEIKIKYNNRIKAEDPALYLWRQVQKRAKKTGIEFTITKEDLFVPTNCPVLGIKMRFSSTLGGEYNSYSVDRINNNIGYVPGNVHVISRRANHIKNDATAEELEKVLQYMKLHA